MQQYSEFIQKKSHPLLGSRMIVISKFGWRSYTLIIKHVSEKLYRLIKSWYFFNRIQIAIRCNIYKIRKLFKNIPKRNTTLYRQLLGLLSYFFGIVLCYVWYYLICASVHERRKWELRSCEMETERSVLLWACIVV